VGVGFHTDAVAGVETGNHLLGHLALGVWKFSEAMGA
jgi:hypothetical protein